MTGEVGIGAVLYVFTCVAMLLNSHKEVQPCNHDSVWSRSEINYSFRQQTRVMNPDAPHWNYDR